MQGTGLRAVALGFRLQVFFAGVFFRSKSKELLYSVPFRASCLHFTQNTPLINTKDNTKSWYLVIRLKVSLKETSGTTLGPLLVECDIATKPDYNWY